VNALFLLLMIFTAPIEFKEAAQSREVRSILPTTLSSAELEEIEAAILERARFSARMNNAEVVQSFDTILEAYDAGRLDLATAQAKLLQAMRDSGIESPEGEAGQITDFLSTARRNLMLTTTSAMAAGYGNWKYNQQPPILDQWPAQELFRAAPARQPRNWYRRWQDAGGQLFDGKMIALRNTDIWTRISRFGTPYPPFDFGSHMRTRLVDRDKSVSLGLIDRDTQVAPQDRGFNDDLRFTPDVRAAALRRVLEEEGYRFEGDVLTL